MNDKDHLLSPDELAALLQGEVTESPAGQAENVQSDGSASSREDQSEERKAMPEHSDRSHAQANEIAILHHELRMLRIRVEFLENLFQAHIKKSHAEVNEFKPEKRTIEVAPKTVQASKPAEPTLPPRSTRNARKT